MSKIADTREVILTSDAAAEHWSAAVWDPRTGSMLFSYKNAAALAPGTLQLLKDNYVIAADAIKPRIYVWPLNNPHTVTNLRLTTPGKVTALASTPSSSYIIVAVSEKLFIWQTCNGRLLGNLNRHYQTVTCLSVSKDGSMFASGAEDGLIFVWSLNKVLNEENATPLHALSHHSLPVKDLQFGHGSRGRLCSVSIDRTCNIYDPSHGTLLLSLVLDVPLNCVRMNTRESDLFIGCTDGTIYQFNLYDPPRGIEHHVKIQKDNDEERIVFKGHTHTVVSLSISVDGRYLLSGGADKKVYVWDITSRQILRTIDHTGPIGTAFFAKQYENFRVQDLVPCLQLSNLQRMSDETGKESLVQTITRDRNPEDILNFESFVQTAGAYKSNDITARKLAESREEIERLRKINAEIYRYTVNCILNKTAES